MAKQIVVFKLADQEYGVDIMRVIEIVSYQSVRPVPEVPAYIEGIINLRSEIYPIYNLRTRFKMTNQVDEQDTKIILMKLQGIQIGFRVDQVSEILTISETDIEVTPKIISRYDSKYITGVTKKGNKMILLLDVELLVSDEDQQAIAELA